jgi:hypothetical protein
LSTRWEGLLASPTGQRVAQRVRPHLVAWATPLIRQALSERRHAVEAVSADLEAARVRLRAVEREAERNGARFDRTPLGPSLTIHAAHARDPQVQQVFSTFGLPNCPACPVGADETIAEAAFAEGFDAAALIAALGALGLN